MNIMSKIKLMTSSNLGNSRLPMQLKKKTYTRSENEEILL